jgi:beta-glucanase (GH16 family)
MRTGCLEGVLASVLVVSAGLAAPGAHAAKPATRPPVAQGTFTDQFTSFDGARWIKADGWANGSPFDNGWRADHATLAGGLLDLRLDDVLSSGQPYTSGEVRTTGYYGYGCYEASFKPARTPGVVSAFFTFAGPYDNGGNGRHNEIDVEFLGYDTTRVQFNFYTNDDTYASRNEELVDLGFDAADALHRYAFKWTSQGIDWFVDGQRVYSALNSDANPTPKAGESLQKIMVNVWPVDETAAGWAGVFAYPGQALHGVYDWVRYTAGEDCTIGPPPTEPPPPTGSATEVVVQQVAMSLDTRATQAIAKVTVVDDLGRPVSGATVLGTWSGVISSGDGSRTTDTAGAATFYSSRTRAPGAIQFCVTGVQAGGLAYDGVSNLATCGAIVK